MEDSERSSDRHVAKAIELLRAEIEDLAERLAVRAEREAYDLEDTSDFCHFSCNLCALEVARTRLDEDWDWARSRTVAAASEAVLALAMERLKADAVHARVWRSAHARPTPAV